MAKRAVIFALLLTGCRDPEPPPAPAEPETHELDELRALGYLAFTEETPAQTGLVRRDELRSQPGYTLYATRVRCHAALVDERGETVHTWHLPDCRGWDHTELLDGGDLLAAGKTRQRAALLGRHTPHDRFLVRLDRNSKVLWRRDLWAHHDAIALPDGRIAALTSELRSIPRAHRRIPMRDDSITVLDGDSFSLYDLLSKNDIGFRLQKVAVSRERIGSVVDLLHTNAIHWLDGDRALVCMRHQDTIALVDGREKKLLWAWGQGELSGPHDVSALANGHYLVFDNGLSRKRSRVVEVDPSARAIVWQYGWGKGELEFFTRSHGSAQRLANGNTLIAISDAARIVEITAGGDVVWEYFSPRLENESKHATINRARRIPATEIDGWLRQHFPLP